MFNIQKKEMEVKCLPQWVAGEVPSLVVLRRLEILLCPIQRFYNTVLSCVEMVLYIIKYQKQVILNTFRGGCLSVSVSR